MAHLKTPCRFHHVERPDHIAVEIGARIFQAVAYARLGCQMHDHVGGKRLSHGPKALLVLQQAFGRRKPFILQKHRMSLLLERDIIIIRHPVIAVDAESVRQQEIGEVEPDEPRGARNKNACHAVLSRLRKWHVTRPRSSSWASGREEPRDRPPTRYSDRILVPSSRDRRVPVPRAPPM